MQRYTLFFFRANSTRKIDHLYGSHGCFISLIPVPSAGTVFGLLYIFRCQHAEDERDSVLKIQLGDPLGNGGTYIIKMGSITTHNAPNDNNSIDLFVLCHFSCSVRQFKTAGYSLYTDIFFRCAMTLQGITSSLK